MAFDATALSLATDTIGGGSLRFFFLHTTDDESTVCGTNYFTGGEGAGLRVGDLVICANPSTGATFSVSIWSISAAGHASAKPADDGPRSLLSFIPLQYWGDIIAGTSTVDVTSYVRTALSTVKKLYVPAGRYRITDMITVQNGGAIYGDDRTLSIFYADDDFNLSALGVVRLGTAPYGATMLDIGVMLDQPDVSSRDDMVDYPPAIYMIGSTRCVIDNVRISGARIGIDATGNTGGLFIGRLEVGAIYKGIVFDGALDFIHGDSIHCWPYGFETANKLIAYSDQQTIAAEVGEVDGWSVSKFSTFRAMLVFNDSGTTYIPHSIADLDMDGDGARLVFDTGRRLEIGVVYSTKADKSNPTIVQAGGYLGIGRFVANEAGDHSIINVTGGDCSIGGGYIAQLVVGQSAAEVSGGRLSISATRLELPATSRSVAYVKQSSTGVLEVVNCSAPTAGASGPVVEIGADLAGHRIANNGFTGWSITLPANASLGCYGPNRIAKSTKNLTVSFATNGDFVPTYTSRTMTYWFTERGVEFFARIVFSANSYTTASGDFLITGFPITPSMPDIAAFATAGPAAIDYPSGRTQAAAVWSASSSAIVLQMSGDNTTPTTVGTTHIPAGTGSVDISISGFLPSL